MKTVILSLVGLVVGWPQSWAQIQATGRSPRAYHSDSPLDPATLMSQLNFDNTSRHNYVVVEGYIDYVAGTISKEGNTTRVSTEADGDFHFEMQSTNAARPPGESPNGLVCEIDPPWQLSGWQALSQISRREPSTYRKVRVYGELRFGTEAHHSGTRTYQYGNGRTITGHWEIHPIERLESIDNGKPFTIGPAAHVGSWPIAQRYKVSNATFAKQSLSNYATLTGKIQRIAQSPDGSGDIDLWITTGSRRYIATIPQYYISGFDSTSQTVTLLQLPPFRTIGFSLRPDPTKTRILYGLRNWRFRLGVAYPVLQPVEMVR